MATSHELRPTALRVINGHYQLRCDQCLDLQQLQAVLPMGRLYIGRPTMLSCQLLGKRVQFFPNGTIQVLAGKMTAWHFQRLHVMIRDHLRRYSSVKAATTTPNVIQVTQWFVNNIVIYFELNTSFTFTGITCNGCVSYEPELFPALLLAKSRTARVTLFPNGKGIVTGVRSVLSARTVLNTVIRDLSDRCRRHHDLH